MKEIHGYKVPLPARNETRISHFVSPRALCNNGSESYFVNLFESSFCILEGAIARYEVENDQVLVSFIDEVFDEYSIAFLFLVFFDVIETTSEM